MNPGKTWLIWPREGYERSPDANSFSSSLLSRRWFHLKWLTGKIISLVHWPDSSTSKNKNLFLFSIPLSNETRIYSSSSSSFFLNFASTLSTLMMTTTTTMTISTITMIAATTSSPLVVVDRPCSQMGLFFRMWVCQTEKDWWY